MNINKLKLSIVFLILAISISSCNKKQKEKTEEAIVEDKTEQDNSIVGNVYTSKEINWSITIPDYWMVIPQEESDSTDAMGKQFLEENSEIIIDDSELKNLISFFKDELNIFAATAEPFIEEYEGEYLENNRLINDLIYNTITSQGIRIDSSFSKEIINDREFYHFTNKIYDPEGNLFITQTLFSSLVNGYDFAVNMAYSNDSTKAELMNAFKNSKFN